MFRRGGKLSFLSTKDDRIKVINERINLTEKHLIEMCTSFSTLTRKMAKYRDAYDELAKAFKNYAEDEEVNESLSSGLKSFTNSSTTLADHMDLKVHRMEVKVINELAQFEILCKTTRENLRTATVAKDKEVLKQRQMLEIKSKFSSNNSAADSELLKAQLEVSRANKEIDDIIKNFEKRKLTDVKTILNDFIMIAIKYHAKSLETLTASYYDISNIDERGDFLEFQKLLKTKEETQSKQVKQVLKKELKSKSMEHLDKDPALSPIKQHSRLTRSIKNLNELNDEGDGEDDDNDEEEEDDDEEDESESNAEDYENSASVSEDPDDDNASETPSEDRKSIAPFKKSKESNKQRSAAAAAPKDPFKAAASHVTKSKHSMKYQPLNEKFRSGIPSLRSGNSLRRLNSDVNATAVSDGSSSDGDGRNRYGSGRLVTVVKSMKSHENEVIDCTASSGVMERSKRGNNRRK